MIKMVVFLGNNGYQYKKTRHNIPWIYEEFLNINEKKTDKFNGKYYKKDNVIYLLPHTLMNKSGEAVNKAMIFFKIDIKEILVVHDDLELDFGSFKFKDGGGLGGHNGLRSIKELTGSSDFHRLAIGISRPVKESVATYVLQRFDPIQESQLELIFNEINRYFFRFITEKDYTNGKKIVVL